MSLHGDLARSAARRRRERWLGVVSRLHAVAEALDDVWEGPSSQPGKRKTKKRRKRKLLRTSSFAQCD